MNSTSPVLTKRELEMERVCALEQKEYYPIINLQVTFPDNSIATYTRYSFSAEDRELIAKGADLLLSQPHHSSMMPIGLQLAMPGEYPVE